MRFKVGQVWLTTYGQLETIKSTSDILYPGYPIRSESNEIYTITGANSLATTKTRGDLIRLMQDVETPQEELAASEAHRIAAQIVEQKIKSLDKELSDYVFSEIKKAADEGNFTVSFNYILPPFLEDRLKVLGYNVSEGVVSWDSLKIIFTEIQNDSRYTFYDSLY